MLPFQIPLMLRVKIKHNVQNVFSKTSPSQRLRKISNAGEKNTIYANVQAERVLRFQAIMPLNDKDEGFFKLLLHLTGAPALDMPCHSTEASFLSPIFHLL